MSFFFDRCIAERLTRIISAYDTNNSVTHLDRDSRFNPETTDVELIQRLNEDRPPPVFVTADDRMRKRPNERKALAESKLTIVFFKPGWHDHDFHSQAVKLLTRWPDIVRETSRAKEPYAFEISASFRKIEPLCPTRSLIRS